MLARLGLLEGVPACTDSTTRPWVVEAGVRVIDESFVAAGNVATAGGCMSSQYLAAWVIARLAGFDAAAGALRYVAPVGEREDYVSHVLGGGRALRSRARRRYRRNLARAQPPRTSSPSGGRGRPARGLPRRAIAAEGRAAPQ
jgi:transcriptional regulator GlxA family with amidase domain